jgi:hypothetical protein
MKSGCIVSSVSMRAKEESAARQWLIWQVASCLGSALETCLILMVSAYENEIPSDILPTKKRETKALLDWSLHDLIIIARDCDWLPAGLCLDDDWDRKRAKIGDYAVVIKEVRNLVHPARVLVQLPKGRVTKRHSKVTAVAFEAAVDHLEVKVHKSLARRIEEEERTKAARRSATVPAAAS